MGRQFERMERGLRYDRVPMTKEGKKRILLRLLGYIGQYWYYFVLAIALTILANQLSLMGPRFSGDAVDAIAAADGVDFPAVWENVKKLIFCYGFSALASYILAVLMIFIGQKIVYTMRRQLFEKLNTLPINFFDTTATGDIVSRISYDVDTINTSLSQDLVQVMTSLYVVVGSVIFMWHISPPMLVILVITVPFSILFARYRSGRVRPLFRMRSQKLGELNGYAEEMLSGSRTIANYHREDEMDRRFARQNKDAMDAFYNAERSASFLGPTINFINNISLTMVIIFGGVLYMYSQNEVVQKGSLFFISLGGVAQFVQYSRRFAGPINEFANIMHEFQSAMSAAERVFRVLDAEPEKADLPDACPLRQVQGEVSFEHVNFGYTKDQQILQELSVSVKPGQTIAIVGPTGAGKTTIINLLMRFYDTNAGTITIDGHPTDQIRRRDLRKAYTMVLQDTWLFHGTIFQNIAYGREGATREDVEKAARAARIHEYIVHLPKGYDTVLSDGGANISKGQRQLITIARAMLSEAPMLIMDEATSNVDSRTEKLLQQAMAELMHNRTSFVIAHRLSTIQNADVILVLKDGEIIEQGNHETLMALGGTYCSLYQAQFQ